MEVTASIHLVGEKTIKKLNKKFLGRDKVTDVLSFPLVERGTHSASSGHAWNVEKVSELGDVFLCVPRIKKQAREYGVCFEEEFCRMLTHGVLHLLGFDHQNKKEAKKMFDLQEKIIKKL